MSIKDIESYLIDLPEEVLPKKYLEKASVFLSGSIGWGVKRDTDEDVDWDLFILLEDRIRENLTNDLVHDHVFDDHDHKPHVFGQIRSFSWVEERLNSSNRKWWPLYFWIFKYGKWVTENDKIKHIVNDAYSRFKKDNELLLRE